jgi:hypothetical protein
MTMYVRKYESHRGEKVSWSINASYVYSKGAQFESRSGPDYLD